MRRTSSARAGGQWGLLCGVGGGEGPRARRGGGWGGVRMGEKKGVWPQVGRPTTPGAKGAKPWDRASRLHACASGLGAKFAACNCFGAILPENVIKK